MAYVMLLPKGMSEMPYVFLTDHAVGVGCRNQRDDVLLVQFFLAALSADVLTKGNARFNYIDKKGTPYDYTVAGQQPMKIDGVCGSQTIAYIKKFQTEGSKGSTDRWLTMVADGKVHPTRRGDPWTRSGHVLSIIRLNTEYSAIYGIDRMMALHQQVGFPLDLLPSLYMGF